jgi:hypothetical protein
MAAGVNFRKGRFMLVRLFVLLLVVGLGSCTLAPQAPLADTAIAHSGNRLAEDIGYELPRKVFNPVLWAGVELPRSTSLQIHSTEDAVTALRFRLAAALPNEYTQLRSLGYYEVSIPPLPAEQFGVTVELTATVSGIRVRALDAGGRELPLKRLHGE